MQSFNVLNILLHYLEVFDFSLKLTKKQESILSLAELQRSREKSWVLAFSILIPKLKFGLSFWCFIYFFIQLWPYLISVLKKNVNIKKRLHYKTIFLLAGG